MTIAKYLKQIKNNVFYRISFKLENNIFFPLYLQDLSISSKKMKDMFGKNIPIVITYESESNYNWFLEKEKWDKIYDYLMRNLQKEAYFKRIKENIDRYNKLLEQFIQKIDSIKRRKLEKKEIFDFYGKYLSLITDFRVFAIIPNILSMGSKNITDEYKKLLSKQLTNEKFSTLTTPEKLSSSTLAERELLDMMINKEDDIPLQKWIEKWGYIYYYYTGPLPTVADVRKLMSDLEKNYKNIKERMNDIDDYKREIRLKQKNIIKDLKLTKRDMHLLSVLTFFNHYKLERKELMQKSYVVFDIIFERLKELTGMAVEDLKFLTIRETKDIVDGKNKQALSHIKIRKKELLTITDSKGISFINDKKDMIDVLNNIKEFVPKQKMIIAYSSNEPVIGKLIFINTKEDLKKVETTAEKFILASNTTYPALLPAMVKCTGILTKVGGMTSHAAIVARELKKPCIVGYDKLFEEFKEGDIVEINTSKGTVRKVS